VDQWKPEKIGHLTEPAARQQLRTAYGKQLFGAEPDGVESGPIAVAVAYRKIDLLARKVDMMQRRGDAKVDPGARFGKVAEPVHEPLGGKVRRGADGKNARALPLQQPLCADGDAVECIAYDIEIIPARFSDDEALAFAIEELDGKFGFQRLDLVTNRARVKLSCRAAASKAFRAFNGGSRGRIVSLDQAVHEKN
jgi:hypothetical protein